MDEQQLAKLHEFKKRTKEEIAQIENWMQQTPKTPIGLQLPNGPILWFRRFTDAEVKAIYDRSPKTDAEAQELVLKDPTADEQARVACAQDLENCSLEGFKKESWLTMHRADLLSVWSQLYHETLRREEEIEKFRANNRGENVG